jgi:DNA polymerase/3'-5' exonuclease PolX
LKRQEAEAICRDLIVGAGHLGIHFKKYAVCGSIRRLKEVVKDIDIVSIPKTEY